MPSLPKIERTLKIIQLLSGRNVTVGDLYDYFDRQVPKRTLQRDLRTISESGIPVQSRKINKNENEWWIESGFRSLPAKTINLPELLAAHILKENLKSFRGTKFQIEIKELLNKLNQLIPESVFLESEKYDIENVFQNYSSGDFDYSSYSDIIDDIISAILKKNECFIKYFHPEQSEETYFVIEPEKILYYNGGLYLIAYTRHYKRFILLAVQRIKTLKIKDKIFANDHPFKPDEFWSSRFGMFGGEKKDIVLQFSKEIKHHIQGRQWHSSQSIEEDAGGNLILKMTVAQSPELVTWILGWSVFVKVLSPSELIEEILDKIKKVENNYIK
ncbi:MAG: WYL domain-containing protein [Candidatus Marinimicrobia bacterium]|nr:WYL domain-containing protein [Candidatus Neomarinimicrobiota bacterium]